MKEGKNYETFIKEELSKGKVVFINKINEDIDGFSNFDIAKSFDNKQAFIDWYNKEQTEKECDYTVYRTAEQAWVLSCNNAYTEYISRYDDNYDEIYSAETFREKLRAIKSYDEFIKDIDVNSFVDGFYDWEDLKFPFVDEENVKHVLDMNIYIEKTDEDVKTTRSFEIHFN